MNNYELVAKLQNVVDNFNTVYMWGVFGSPVTENLIQQKARQYPSWYTASRQAEFRKLIGKGYFGFDCVNLIKGILWGWNGDSLKSHGGAVYNTNEVPDVSANGMLTRLIDVSSDFSKIEVGEAVWIDAHIGVYIGEGKVIEATPSWANKVQVTACLNIKSISGIPGRRWTKHGRLPYITYVTKDKNELKQESLQWAIDARNWAIETGISDGSRPRDFATREEIWRMLQKMKRLG